VPSVPSVVACDSCPAADDRCLTPESTEIAEKPAFRVEHATLKAAAPKASGLIWKERPRERGLQCTKMLGARRSSGSGRQQMPVLRQNDFIDGVNDSVCRDKIRLFDAGAVHPYVSGDYRCS
jgi:hypothetical protein